MYQEPEELEESQTAPQAAEVEITEDKAQQAPGDEPTSASEVDDSVEPLAETEAEQEPDAESAAEPEIKKAVETLDETSAEAATQPEPEADLVAEPEVNEPVSAEETEPEAVAEPETSEPMSAEETEPEAVAEPEMIEPASAEPTELAAAVEPDAVGAIAPQPEGLETGEPSPDQPAWFVVHCYSGYENKVRHNLEQRIETMGMKDKIFDVVIPTQEEIEVKEGKRRTVERHIFPGYVLVNMILTEESWYVVRNTPGVTGFVGMGTTPTPLRPEEVSQIIKRMEAEAPRVKVSFKVGERVRIIDGPFNDFRGTVAEIDVERTKVRVMVSMFGRDTPVELDFLQVERA